MNKNQHWILKILLAPFKLIKWIITFILDVIGVTIISIGLIFYGLSFFIKDFSKAKILIQTTIKKMLE